MTGITYKYKFTVGVLLEDSNPFEVEDIPFSACLGLLDGNLSPPSRCLGDDFLVRDRSVGLICSTGG